MNGVDKGLVLLQNKPLIAHVIARLKSQADEILINANLHPPKALGYAPTKIDLTAMPAPVIGALRLDGNLGNSCPGRRRRGSRR